MLRHKLWKFVITSVVFSFASLANATYYYDKGYDFSWHDDNYYYNGDQLGIPLYYGKSIDIDFDINGDGFEPGQYRVEHFDIKLQFWTDRDYWISRKGFGIDFEYAEIEGPDGFSVEFEVDPYHMFSSNTWGLDSLNSSGLLSLNLSGLGGEYWSYYWGHRYDGYNNGFVKLKAAKLWAYGDSVSVPEPATLPLLGLGLIALGFMRRRKVQ